MEVDQSASVLGRGTKSAKGKVPGYPGTAVNEILPRVQLVPVLVVVEILPVQGVCTIRALTTNPNSHCSNAGSFNKGPLVLKGSHKD